MCIENVIKKGRGIRPNDALATLSRKNGERRCYILLLVIWQRR